VQLPAGVRGLPLFQNAHTISGTNPATYSVAAGSPLPRLKENSA